MKPYAQTIRTLAADFFVRLYKPFAITLVAVFICLLGVSLWLTTTSDLWWILVIILIILTILVVIALAIAWAIIRLVTPTQSKEQRRQARALVDKLQRIADVTATPKPVLLFRVVKDIIAPSKQGFIASISQDTLSLKQDFSTLRDSFK